MKKGTAADRARRFVKHLLAGNSNWLGSRSADNCFEMGDGEEVYRHAMRLLKQAGITRYEELSSTAQWYTPRDWFTPDYMTKHGLNPAPQPALF